MKLDLSCPVEMRGYSLSYADNAVNASVRLYNLSARRIASFEAIAKWRSRVSGKSIAAPFCAERLRAGGEKGFRIELNCSRLPDADQLELVFTSIRFDDGDNWRAGEGMIVDIAPLEVISSSDLSALRTIAGDDAVCFPKLDEHIWRCVCGRTNSNAEKECARCHRERRTAIGYTPENVRFLSGAIHPEQPVYEETEPSELHAAYLRQRARLFRRTLTTAIAALALTVLLAMSYQPVDAGNANAEAINETLLTIVEE